MALSTAITDISSPPANAKRNRRARNPSSVTHASQLPRYAHEVASTRTVLRREYADAGAASDLVDGVEQIDDVEAHRQRFAVRHGKFVREAGVELRIGRFGADIGVAGAQSRAVDHVGRGFCS